MSKINFFALGGLGEQGKNLYVCDVNNHFFILDAGLKYPNIDQMGVDNIYPNINYLKENENKIVGLFLTHAHEENIGAAVEIIKNFSIGVFGSHFTISVLEEKIKDSGLDPKDYRLYKINEDKILKFGKVSVQAYFVCHTIPETVSYAIITEDGAIVYSPDFTFEIMNDRKYRISFDKIMEIANGGVLALAVGSLGVNNIIRTHNNASLEYYVSQLAMKNKRFIISMYSTDLVKLQRVINICKSYNKRIAISGRKTQKLIASAISLGYLDVDEEQLVNLRFMDEDNLNNDPDLAIIVTGERHEPYYSIQRMCRGQDKLVKIEEDDEILFIAPVETGCERIASRTKDELLMIGAKYYAMTDEEVRSGYADSEELKMLYNMLKPKYLIPIDGEYRHQYVHKKIGMQYGFKEDHILLASNGDVLTFEDGRYKGISEKIDCGDVLVNGSIVGNVNEVVLRDRELLSEEGIILVSSLIDKKNKKVVDGPIVTSAGYIYDDNDSLLDDIKNETKRFFKMYFKLIIPEGGPSCNELLRDCLMQFIYKKTQNRPIIVPGIVEIE